MASPDRLDGAGSPLPAHSPKELTTHRSTLPALTGIRFFAAMYVVFYHSHLPDSLDQHHLSIASTIVRNGLLAVPLFFILSGLILSYTYEGQIARTGGSRRFWEARFARVWPLYAVSLLLSTIFTHTTPSSPTKALATLAMVQAWNPFDMGMAGAWNFVCWTLSTEAFFYLAFPCLQLWLERRRSKLVLVVLIVALTIAIGFATGGINYQDTRGIRHIPLAVTHLPEFIIGVCAGNLFLRFRTGQNHSHMPIAVSAGKGTFTYAAAIGSLLLLSHSARSWTAWTPLAFSALLFCLAAEKSILRSFLSSRLVIVGGQISYGIYLLQWPCKAIVNKLCDQAGIFSAPTRFVIDCVVLILLSAAGFYAIEEPARRLFRALFSRMNEAETSFRVHRGRA